jgi:tetraacyldisaccharide 4'-kinase
MATLHARFFGYISGERGGAAGASVRAGLSALSVLYRVGCSARRALYHCGLLLTHELDARVISVGNITTGGTGKTPLVIWIGRWLQRRGVATVILSRGYGQKAPGGVGESDETLLFRRYLPRVPHLIGKNRHATGLQAIRDHVAECILLDDGFQNAALGRDLDVVLIDALMPFGYGHLLPRGLLREPLTGLRRAGLFVLTRCDLATKDQVKAIGRQIQEICGRRPVVESAHRPVRFYRHLADESRPLDWIQGRRVYAFSALGNPMAFPKTLEALGAVVAGHEAFRDHHWYDAADLSAVARAATEAGAEAVLTTEKDAIKIPSFPEGAPPLYVLAVEMSFTSGEELLVSALDHLIAP